MVIPNASYRKKLIEVALPLEAINKESAHEKVIPHGHPSTLHLWWARRPLAACRAVLFSQLVDDPSEYMPDEASANEERQRLFKIIEDLVLWENINNEEVLDKAKLEIARSVARDLGVDVPVGKQAIREFLATQAPPVLDPFAGGGSIPLEAQRLGLRAYASDLNPVAVLINKALIEIPPKFAGMPPVHPPEAPSAGKKGKKAGQGELWKKEWKGAEGLAEDVRYYGKWMRDEAYKRIGHLYPPVKITQELLEERPDLKAQGLKPGDELTVIAWLWARTVKCPNPACGAQMPLIRSFVLSTKKGKQIKIEPVVKHSSALPIIQFKIEPGQPKLSPPKIGRGAQFRCLACAQIAPEKNIREEFIGKRDDVCLIGIVALFGNNRVYLSPNIEHEGFALNIRSEFVLEEEMNSQTPNLVSGRGYGITHWRELFTERQMITLMTIGILLDEITIKIREQCLIRNIDISYSDAIRTYLAESYSKLSTFTNKLAYWRATRDQSASGFGRQALAMTWDYTEINPFAGAAGDFSDITQKCANIISKGLPASPTGRVFQSDARKLSFDVFKPIISTDPPYYDNVGYADLSDFFYIWLRRFLGSVYPQLFATMLTPKQEELVAMAYRFGGNRTKAKEYFEDGLRQVFINLRETANIKYPISIFYAFKQSELDEDDDVVVNNSEFAMNNRTSTGWETMLESLLNSGFQILGTWPMRTELIAALKSKIGALASSIILVCRPRSENTPPAARREFLAILKRELPPALRQLQQGSIAPVDLAQAAIGPGMAVFSRYKQVLEADGSPMRVRTALGLINQALDEYLAEQEGEYDTDTRWALAWYEQYGHEQGPYGVAETLSKAKNTSVEGLVDAGILEARAGKVRLLRRDELDPEWDPLKDKRPTAWEACQHLIHNLEKGGEQSAAALLAELGGLSETARDLPTGCTPSASERAGRKTPWGITCWWCPGRG